MRTNLLLASMTFICTPLLGQIQAGSAVYTRHAQISDLGNGTFSVAANSPRPLNQALEAVRREFGWVVDYEDPVYRDADLDATGGLIGGSLSGLIDRPQNTSPEEEIKVLDSLIRQQNDRFLGHPFKLVQSGPRRFDVVPSGNQARNLLDTPIALSISDKPVGQAIDAVLSAVTAATGVKVQRGGLLDADIELTRTSLAISTQQPERNVLNQILTSTRARMFWLMTYDSSTKSYHIGIQPTVRVVHDGSGVDKQIMIMNPKE